MTKPNDELESPRSRGGRRNPMTKPNDELESPRSRALGEWTNETVSGRALKSASHYLLRVNGLRCQEGEPVREDGD